MFDSYVIFHHIQQFNNWEVCFAHGHLSDTLLDFSNHHLMCHRLMGTFNGYKFYDKLDGLVARKWNQPYPWRKTKSNWREKDNHPLGPKEGKPWLESCDEDGDIRNLSLPSTSEKKG